MQLSGVDLPLPSASLSSVGTASGRFLALGIDDFQSAALFVRKLPYGRHTPSGDYMGVLQERRGTCSTKHALLAQVALEQHLPVTLRLGIYAMNGTNTPGVGGVLTRYRLDAIPEAHCYLEYLGTRVDLTHASSTTPVMTLDIVHEELIQPAQIGDRKRARHQQFMREYCCTGEPGIPHFEEMWRIREECIAALTG